MTGANKKKTFTVLKSIRITDAQAKNWDPDMIRSFLDAPTEVDLHIDIIRKFTEVFLNNDIDVDLSVKEFECLDNIYIGREL